MRQKALLHYSFAVCIGDGYHQVALNFFSAFDPEPIDGRVGVKEDGRSFLLIACREDVVVKGKLRVVAHDLRNRGNITGLQGIVLRVEDDHLHVKTAVGAHQEHAARVLIKGGGSDLEPHKPRDPDPFGYLPGGLIDLNNKITEVVACCIVRCIQRKKGVGDIVVIEARDIVY